MADELPVLGVRHIVADFETLLVRRDELAREHERACAILEEEPHPLNHRKCVKLYDELAKVQREIDDALAVERRVKDEGTP